MILAIRGFYEMDFGGHAMLNPVALLAHRLGYRSATLRATSRA